MKYPINFGYSRLTFNRGNINWGKSVTVTYMLIGPEPSEVQYVMMIGACYYHNNPGPNSALL